MRAVKMLDYIKAVTTSTDEVDKVWQNEILHFDSEGAKLVFNSDEVRTYKSKRYKNLIFVHKGQSLGINGSVHKYKNCNENYPEGYNGDRFTMCQCIDTIFEIQSRLNLDLRVWRVVGLEYALNVTLPQQVSNKYLLENAVYYKRSPMIQGDESEYIKRSHPQGDNRNKLLKLYCKDLHQPLTTPPNTLRIELKAQRSQQLHIKGIKTLEDLTTTAVYANLGADLVQAWNDLFLLDVDNAKRGDKMHDITELKRVFNELARKNTIQAKKAYEKRLKGEYIKNTITPIIKHELSQVMRC